MPKLFGVDIAAQIAKGFKGKLLTATLTRVTPGTRTSGSLTEGTNPQNDDYTCEGFTSDYNEEQMQDSLIEAGDRKVILIGNSLPTGVVPVPGDKVTIEDTTYNVIRVKRDPAAATYACQVRG